MQKQVDKTAYNFNNYCYPDRWMSYWHQIYEILNLNPKNVLEIGVGDKIVANYLKNNTNIIYKCADLAADLAPDIVCSIDNIKADANSFDLVCAFEVLEHLPFARFDQSLRELYRVAKKYAIISLPHWGRHFAIDIRLPFFKRIKWQSKINLFPIKHKFNGQHYWEIGKKGFPLKLIKNKMRGSGFKILKDYIVFESPYHHFFILKK